MSKRWWLGAAGIAIGGAIFVLWLWNALPSVGGTHTESQAIQFWHDDQRHVGCWVYASGYKGGISCLPDGQYTP